MFDVLVVVFCCYYILIRLWSLQGGGVIFIPKTTLVWLRMSCGFLGAVTISFSEPNAQNRTKLYYLNVVTRPLEKGVNGE